MDRNIHNNMDRTTWTKSYTTIWTDEKNVFN